MKIPENHALPPVVVPGWYHTVRMEFRPELYKTRLPVSAISSVFLYLSAGILVFVPATLTTGFLLPGRLCCSLFTFL